VFLFGAICDFPTLYRFSFPTCRSDLTEICKKIAFFQRIFADGEYVKAGASVQEDLSGASVVLAVKEVPLHR
jgi:hypothetical protein